MAITIKGLKCPSCGGTVEIKEGKLTVVCPFCKTASLLKGEKGIARYYVPSKIDVHHAKQIAYRWLGGINKAFDLRKVYKVEELSLAYAPFFRFKSHVIGWILGKVERRSKHGVQLIPVERKIDFYFDWNIPACNLGEFGVKEIDLEGDEILPFTRGEVEKEGTIFEPTLSSADASREASWEVEKKIYDGCALDLVTFKKYHQIKKNMSIVYYPLWIMRYTYKNRSYVLVIDGEDGKLLFGRAPDNHLFRASAMTFSTLLGSLLTATASSYFPYGGVFMLLPALLLIYIGYSIFKASGEVVFQRGNIYTGDISSIWKIIKEKIPPMLLKMS